MDRCNDLCTRETTGQCSLCEALAERDRFIRLWMKGGFLREGLRAMQRGFSREAAAHKAVVWRSIAAIWHQGQVEALEEVIAPTYVHHTSHTAGDGGHEVHGPDGVRRAVMAWRNAFPIFISPSKTSSWRGTKSSRAGPVMGPTTACLEGWRRRGSASCLRE